MHAQQLKTSHTERDGASRQQQTCGLWSPLRCDGINSHPVNWYVLVGLKTNKTGSAATALVGGTAQSKNPFIFYFGKKWVRFSTLPKKTLATCASISGDFGASATKLCFCQKWRKRWHHHGQNCFRPSSWPRQLRGNLPRRRVRRGLAHTPSRAKVRF